MGGMARHIVQTGVPATITAPTREGHGAEQALSRRNQGGWREAMASLQAIFQPLV
jgi:hypothetical protein